MNAQPVDGTCHGDSAPESPWHALATWEGQVASAVRAAVEAACPPDTRLYAPVARIVRRARDEQGRGSNRLFPLAVLGALTGEPGPAVPVAAISTLWWAGAEALDDLADGSGRASHELLIGGVACLELLPRRLLDTCSLPPHVRHAWSEELLAASVAAGNGQLADAARDSDALDWANVMAAYVGKTGAAYARDAVMAAHLATSDPAALRAWRVFGQLFGVLRQLHNDNVQVRPEDDEDLANATPTLLLAHALETASPVDRAELLALRAAATLHVESRAVLRRWLHEPGVVAGYTGKLFALRQQAETLLHSLVGPSVYRDALMSRVDESVHFAIPYRAEP